MLLTEKKRVYMKMIPMRNKDICHARAIVYLILQLSKKSKNKSWI